MKRPRVSYMIGNAGFCARLAVYQAAKEKYQGKMLIFTHEDIDIFSPDSDYHCIDLLNYTTHPFSMDSSCEKQTKIEQLLAFTEIVRGRKFTTPEVASYLRVLDEVTDFYSDERDILSYLNEILSYVKKRFQPNDIGRKIFEELVHLLIKYTPSVNLMLPETLEHKITFLDTKNCYQPHREMRHKILVTSYLLGLAQIYNRTDTKFNLVFINPPFDVEPIIQSLNLPITVIVILDDPREGFLKHLSHPLNSDKIYIFDKSRIPNMFFSSEEKDLIEDLNENLHVCRIDAYFKTSKENGLATTSWTIDDGYTFGLDERDFDARS